ncbi:SDR family oxidoreductase [Sphingopyxis sp. JAI128]|uniref:SDR family oxidoreductase n=1 Tax=Sphingopyxis sp. JAI128 TaxID=2723066 RepID=UPI00161AF038|nr:SDR family oxidoreductase [Sphingopyxis sp. JAI128]MBB6425766.1 NAD(P)-dependent dehydrogenase (short-subunit alcohol dehydrogenase family) [Sphingopyxis sp. JAI128]
MSRLKGKVAVITGGNSGIGLATAKLFAEEGAQVVITGRREQVIDDAVREIGAGAVGIRGDSADPAHHRELAAFVGKRFDGADIYVANAGVITITDSQNVSEAEYDQQFAINARGTFFGVQSMAPVLRDGSSIICVGSLASDKVLDGHPVYAGTKAAIGAFARAWPLEFKSRGIRVNMLSPGPTDTAIIEKLGVPPEDREGFEAMMAGAIPLGRFGRPQELAQAALFLASDASSFVTGINLRVDGGMALL